MKNLIVISMILKCALSFAQVEESTCAYRCTVSQNQKEVNVELKPVGGYTTDMNTSCIGKLGSTTLQVHNSFGYEMSLLITDKEKNIDASSNTPAPQGRHVLRANGIELKCYI